MITNLEKYITKSILWGALVLGSIVIIKFGILPALQNTKGDFANYYTASRLLADGVSLETAYSDFVWFQKQMDRYGIQHQVGGFIPHPPPTALVFLPLTLFTALTAKKIWILSNIGLVVLNIFLLSRISQLNWLPTTVLFLGTGYGLLNNFLFGQQYLLLVASIILGIYFYQNHRMVLAGISIGLMIPIKYFGILYIFYFAWKKQWRLVFAAVVSALVVIGLTLLMCDAQVFQTFINDVLPHHLRGEVQNPFAYYFQSWNSLFKRLFVFEETLNPHPATNMPALFSLTKNLVFWILLSLTVFIISRVTFQNGQHKFLFQVGFIPLSLLLMSPGSATYHFLLLTISVVFFVKISWDYGKVQEAAFLGILFWVLNLPHFMKLKFLTHGWLNPLAYTRLWFLLLFFILSLYFFRKNINWRLNRVFVWIAAIPLIVGVSTVRGLGMYKHNFDDGAHHLKIDHDEFNRHLGLILKTPDVGKHELVFSYCELLDEEYCIYSADGQTWTPEQNNNFYEPDLASDDASLLVETVVQGRSEIWLSKGRSEPASFVVAGENPSWHPNGMQFAFVKDGVVHIGNIQNNEVRPVSLNSHCYDVAFSPGGNYLAYCVRESTESSLRVFDLTRNLENRVIDSPDLIASPCWSTDERKIVFCRNQNRNRDIWAIDLENVTPVRLTFHPAADTEPAWDAVNERIVFASDRYRGLEFSTLYWVPIPREWQ